jgi:hypothetical protein
MFLKRRVQRICGCPILDGVFPARVGNKRIWITRRRGIPRFAKNAKDPDFLLRGPSYGRACGFL